MRFSILTIATAFFMFSCQGKEDTRPQEVANCQCQTFETILKKAEGNDNASAIILEEMSEIIKCINPFIESLKESQAMEIEKFNNTVDKLVEAQCGEARKKLNSVNTINNFQ